MRRSTHLMRWGALAVMVSLAGTTALGQEQPRQQPSGTRQASCVVRLTYDGELLPLSKDILDALVQAPNVSAEPARRLLGSAVELDEHYNVFSEQMEWWSGPGDTVLVGQLHVVILSDSVNAAAEELLREVWRRLQAALDDIGKQDEARLKQRLARVMTELQRQEAQLAELRALEQQMRAQAGQSDLERDGVLAMVRDLETEQRELEVELAATRAREGALTAQIAKVAAEVEQKVAKSPVARELETIVQIREKELARTQALAKAEGMVSELEVDGAVETLAQARAHLAQYRESASREAVGGDLLAELNKTLMEVLIESAEQESRLRSVEKRLAEIRESKLLELADRYEQEVAVQLSLTGEVVTELMTERHELQRRLSSFRPPELVVIGSE